MDGSGLLRPREGFCVRKDEETRTNSHAGDQFDLSIALKARKCQTLRGSFQELLLVY